MIFLNSTKTVFLTGGLVFNPFYLVILGALLFQLTLYSTTSFLKKLCYLNLKNLYIILFFLNGMATTLTLIFFSKKNFAFLTSMLTNNMLLSFSFMIDGITVFFLGTLLLSIIFLILTDMLKCKLSNQILLLMVFFLFLSCLLIQASNFVFFFCGLIGLNLIIYCLLFLNKKQFRSQEVVLKYFYLSTVTTLLFAYCFWLILEILNTENYFEITYLLFMFNKNNIFLEFMYLVTFLLFFSIFFKLGAFPLHFWTPEIYNACRYTFIYMFSVPIKLLFSVITIRWLIEIFFLFSNFCSYVFLYSAVFSVAFGALGALYEKKTKMFFAYSSINQIGFVLAGCMSINPALFINVMYFLIVYCITSSLFIYGLINIDSTENTYIYLTQNAVFQKHNVFLSWLLTSCLFSFAGIPFFAGFFSKYLICKELYNTNNVLSLWVLLFFSVISTFYYIYLVKIIWFHELTQSFVLGKKSNFLYVIYLLTATVLIWSLLHNRIVYLLQTFLFI